MTTHWLELLLGEVSSHSFFTEYLGKKWLYRPVSAETSKLAGLLTLRDVELLLFNSEREERFVRVVGGSAHRPGEDDAVSRLCSADRAIDEWARGKTLILNNIDRQLPALNELARGLEGQLKCRVWCNLYLTPARGRGLEGHYDSHDVFVLHLIGSKRWRLGENVVDAPMAFQMHRRIALADTAEYAQLTMQPGDVLYIPRGGAHEAVAEDDMSGHLTIGLYPKTYLDLILAAATIAADSDPRFREYLPLGSFTVGGETIAKARQLIERISDGDFGQAGDAFCELLASERRRSPLGVLGLQGSAGQVTEHDRFRAIAHLMSSLTHNGDEMELNAVGQSMTLPIRLAPDVALCCSGKLFSLSDLRGSASERERVDLVRRLIFAGVIERLRPDNDLSDVPVDFVVHSA